MEKSLLNLIKKLKNEGRTAIQIQKYLRENKYNIPWIETMKYFQSLQ